MGYKQEKLQLKHLFTRTFTYSYWIWPFFSWDLAKLSALVWENYFPSFATKKIISIQFKIDLFNVNPMPHYGGIKGIHVLKMFYELQWSEYLAFTKKKL